MTDQDLEVAHERGPVGPAVGDLLVEEDHGGHLSVGQEFAEQGGQDGELHGDAPQSFAHLGLSTHRSDDVAVGQELGLIEYRVYFHEGLQVVYRTDFAKDIERLPQFYVLSSWNVICS